MPLIATKSLGVVSYEADGVIDFPDGVPGFEDKRSFVAVQYEHTAPLVFLQSVEDTDLCFITIPVLAIEPKYHLDLEPEDLARLGLNDVQPRIGEEVLCLSVLSIRDTGPTANLLAPLVINPRNRKAVQAVMRNSDYPIQHVVTPEEAAAC